MGSRITRQVVGIILVVFGIIGKFGAALAVVPDPIIGGMSSVTLGIIISLGISGVKHLDMTSSRNITILGVSHILGIMVPRWFQANPDAIQTGGTIIQFQLL